MDRLGVLGNVSGIATLVVLLVGFSAGRRQLRAHLRAHLEILELWCDGHGAGWPDDSVTWADRLEWSHPRHTVLPQFSAGPIADVGLLQSIFLPEGLVQPVADVNQSISAFNSYLGMIESFKLSDGAMYLAVGDKLNQGLIAVFGTANAAPPPTTSREQFEAVILAAGLTANERRWVEVLAGHMETLHTFFIGAPGGTSLARNVRVLRRAWETFLVL